MSSSHSKSRKWSYGVLEDRLKWFPTLVEKLMRSPIRVVIFLTILVFLIELLIMSILERIPWASAHTEALLDSFTLVFLLFPFFYFFLFRPMSSTIETGLALNKALRESEERYRLLTETANEGIYILGPTGFEYVNPAFQRTTGYPAEKLLRKDFDFMDLIHPDDKDLVLARTKAREKGDKIPSKYEFRLVPRDKEVRDLEISTVELPGEPWRVMGIYRDITERKRAEEQLRSLAAHLSSAREETMIAISRDLHDELGQILTGLKMDAAWLNRKISDEQQGLKEKAESIVVDLNDTIQVVKRITAQLRPVILDDQGLVPALQYEVQEFKKRTGIECRITIEPPELTADKDHATAIYRIVQESLTNIKKHAQASKVVISLKADQDQLVLEVVDDGIGITAEQTEKTEAYGILGMRERVLHLDGEIKIHGAQGQGTQVSVAIPIKRKD